MIATANDATLELRDAPTPEPGPRQLLARVGPEVAGFAPGQRVMGRCAGAFSEYALMDQREAMAMPERFSFEEAAAIPLTFLVVHDMLVLQGRLRPGEWLLVTGVSSGVGVAALQAAKALGAKVIGTSGSQEKLDKLKAAGLDVGLCTRKADFMPAFADGRIRPVIDRVYPFDELAAARAHMESNRHLGKIVLKGAS